MSTSSKTHTTAITDTSSPYVDLTDDVAIDEDPDKTVVAMIAEIQTANGVVAEAVINNDTAPYQVGYIPGGTTSGERFDMEVKNADLHVRANALSRVLRMFPAILQNFSSSKAWMNIHAEYLHVLAHQKGRPDLINAALEKWLTFIELRIISLGDIYERCGHQAAVSPCYECGHFIPHTESQFFRTQNGVPIAPVCLECESIRIAQKAGVRAVREIRSGKHVSAS